ncbi:glycoside hydrolase family 16 protein [Streptomyces sp. CA-135486]|uniref:glycoside hydrolase family 16 protein n=1 Tax=Streptomyces sp. CA-135486 TaxID=3240049 RepID=UPI003D8E9D6E
MRSETGATPDFEGALGGTIDKGDMVFTSQARTFPAGSYEYFVSYKVDDVWHRLSPIKKFTSQKSESEGPRGIPGVWYSVFSDEFNGTSLDREKWATGNPDENGSTEITAPVNTDELQCYDSNLVDVSEGTLNITAIRKPATCGGKEMEYSSGMINSKDDFRQRFGALEARIYLPAATPGVIANWPAFWQVGPEWPITGENDVMEGLIGRACFHFYSKEGPRGQCATGDFTGWHTFGANWQPGRVDYYYDGVFVGAITEGITSAPQWLMLNNSVQPKIGGPTKLPAEMRVDYVRVWQH